MYTKRKGGIRAKKHPHSAHHRRHPHKKSKARRTHKKRNGGRNYKKRITRKRGRKVMRGGGHTEERKCLWSTDCFDRKTLNTIKAIMEEKIKETRNLNNDNFKYDEKIDRDDVKQALYKYLYNEPYVMTGLKRIQKTDFFGNDLPPSNQKKLMNNADDNAKLTRRVNKFLEIFLNKHYVVPIKSMNDPIREVVDNPTEKVVVDPIEEVDDPTEEVDDQIIVVSDSRV